MRVGEEKTYFLTSYFLIFWCFLKVHNNLYIIYNIIILYIIYKFIIMIPYFYFFSLNRIKYSKK